MTTETTGAEAPAADAAPAAEAPVVNSDATTEQQSEAESGDATPSGESGDTNGDDAAAQPKRKHWAHERIDDLTRQRREAERQAEYWKAKATQSVDPNTLEYEEGIAERVSQRHRQEQADTAKETAGQLAVEAFTYRETIARDKFADYDVVARNPNVPITPAMAEIIRDSDVGPDLAYHLGKNPTEAARIAALPSTRQAVELGKLEARVTAPKPLPKQPPAPVNPVSGIAAGGTKDPGEMSMAEFKAWREAKT
jgi:hypothetical protein